MVAAVQYMLCSMLSSKLYAQPAALISAAGYSNPPSVSREVAGCACASGWGQLTHGGASPTCGCQCGALLRPAAHQLLQPLRRAAQRRGGPVQLREPAAAAQQAVELFAREAVWRALMQLKQGAHSVLLWRMQCMLQQGEPMLAKDLGCCLSWTALRSHSAMPLT